MTSVLCGCASDPFLATDARRFRTPVELEYTAFFPQDAYQCGPAALATLLQTGGIAVTPEELVPKVYLPARHGSLQPEILAAGRTYGRVPYVIAPHFSALLAEVNAGRPVLVLQNLGVSALPKWHYAVVVGYSPDDGELILRSGRERRRITPGTIFSRTWERSDNWGMVLLAPGDLPAGDDADRYVSAVAAVESSGHLDMAETAYRAGLERWPDNDFAWLGLGNTAWASGQPAKAERAYRHALTLRPTDPALLNNLATVVAAQQRCAEAREILRRAGELVSGGNPLQSVITETGHELADCRPRQP